MDQPVEMPAFQEGEFVESNPVHLAKYSKDGKLLAVVHLDYSISIWDSNDILVNSFELSFFQTKSPNHLNAYHAAFLEWSASSRYLYYIVDCTGFYIDVYNKKKFYRNFTFDHYLNSLSCHPEKDMLSLVTCIDKLIKLNIENDTHSTLMNYHDIYMTESQKKSSFPSYAQYTGVDNTIILWLQGYLFLVSESGEMIKSLQLKTSQPLQQRLCIDASRKLCYVACRNEILTVSIPEMEIKSSYRDTVNDSPWNSIDLVSTQPYLLAIPENYVVDGPVFYIIPRECNSDVVIHREPKHPFIWGIVYPSGDSLLFCTDHGVMYRFRKQKSSFVWNGPMYPIHFTYIQKNEPGPDTLEEGFEEKFFPEQKSPVDGTTHEIDIIDDLPEKCLPFYMELLPEEEEKLVLESEATLPPALEDIYGHR